MTLDTFNQPIYLLHIWQKSYNIKKHIKRIYSSVDMFDAYEAWLSDTIPFLW